MELPNKKMNKKNEVEKVILDIMRHFGFRRNYQVAEYFKVTPQTLSGWIKHGEIPPKHLIKYKSEVQKIETKKNEPINLSNTDRVQLNYEDKNSLTSKKYSWNRTKKILTSQLKVLLGVPIITTLFISFYVFLIANPIYTSTSKVLPISKDGTSPSGISGVAAQLGVNMPLTIGGSVPWAEVYPEIIKSSNLIKSIFSEKFITKKYGFISLQEILNMEHNLFKYPEVERENRAISEIRKMIKISKDRLSPIVTINVEAFEPKLAADLSKILIKKSGKIQRELKTNRIKQKRLFIEERLITVSSDMKKREKELREFREYNRNLSKSPTLVMKVEQMGREVDLQNTLYITLRTQYEKAKIDEVERDDMVQQIDGPNIPSLLTRPRRGLSIILGLFFGIFLSIFIIYFKETYVESDAV